jgi:hypothetical protein
MNIRSFMPEQAQTVNITVGAASARVALGTNPGIDQVRVMNNGTATVWINFGDSTVTASATTGIPVAPGATEVFTMPSNMDEVVAYMAAIAAGATGIIYATPGAGI